MDGASRESMVSKRWGKDEMVSRARGETSDDDGKRTAAKELRYSVLRGGRVPVSSSSNVCGLEFIVSYVEFSQGG